MSNNDEKYEPADSPHSVGLTTAQKATLFSAEEPFQLEAGGSLGPIEVEYETYGELAADKRNVILIAHALSGDAHVAGWDAKPGENNRSWRQRKPGWWDSIVGPGKAIDTRRFFVICSNVLGSCNGTTGPASLNPRTGKPYALEFPMVTIGDWVRLQAHLLDHLGLDRLYAVIGGSLGGQQALEWALAYPERVQRCVVLAASARLSAQGLGFNAVSRHVIMNDPNFHGGHYYDQPGGPDKGLAAARMLAHITYLSEEAMQAKFGRRLRQKIRPDFGFNIEYEVESYLNYQGQAFVDRFDANSYLYITRAMDYYDAADWGDGDLTAACARLKAKIMLVSFSSDWLYPVEQTRELALAITRNGIPVTCVDIKSKYGHDAFLVESEQVRYRLQAFLESSEPKEALQ
jgi:homoserine O-acetyltransferase